MRQFFFPATIAGGLFLAFTTVTPAQALGACRDIDNDLDRLACYDRESGRTPVSAEVPVDAGDWNVTKDTSDFADTTDVYMSVQSEEPLGCQMFGTPARATLFLRCMENTTSLFISTDCHLASGFGGYGNVEFRIDDHAAASRNFNESTDNKALGLWNGGQSIPFIRQMIGADRLLVRFTPFNQSPVTAAFPITGLEEAIAPLRDACGW